MSTLTTNYSLVKLALTDAPPDITVMNPNWDKIDEELHKLSEKTNESSVSSEEKGKPGGIATLDNTGKVPSSQLPSMDYIPNNQKGVADGVATLGADKKVPAEQLPEISTTKYNSVILYANNWLEGSDGRFYQTVNVSNVATDTKVVVVDVDLDTDDVDAKVAYLEAWAHPSANEVDQGNGTLTFYAWEQPVSNIPINVGVM